MYKQKATSTVAFVLIYDLTIYDLRFGLLVKAPFDAETGVAHKAFSR